MLNSKDSSNETFDQILDTVTKDEYVSIGDVKFRVHGHAIDRAIERGLISREIGDNQKVANLLARTYIKGKDIPYKRLYHKKYLYFKIQKNEHISSDGHVLSVMIRKDGKLIIICTVLDKKVLSSMILAGLPKKPVLVTIKNKNYLVDSRAIRMAIKYEIFSRKLSNEKIAKYLVKVYRSCKVFHPITKFTTDTYMYFGINPSTHITREGLSLSVLKNSNPEHIKNVFDAGTLPRIIKENSPKEEPIIERDDTVYHVTPGAIEQAIKYNLLSANLGGERITKLLIKAYLKGPKDKLYEYKGLSRSMEIKATQDIPSKGHFLTIIKDENLKLVTITNVFDRIRYLEMIDQEQIQQVKPYFSDLDLKPV